MFQVVSKLSFQTPDSKVVFGYLELIASQYGVDYKAPVVKPSGVRTAFDGATTDAATGNRIHSGVCFLPLVIRIMRIMMQMGLLTMKCQHL